MTIDLETTKAVLHIVFDGQKFNFTDRYIRNRIADECRVRGIDPKLVDTIHLYAVRANWVRFQSTNIEAGRGGHPKGE